MRKQIFTPLIAIAIVALTLFGTSSALKGIAEKNAAADFERVLKNLLPGSEAFTEEVVSAEDTDILAAYKGETGFVVQTVTQGYADEIVMLVGVSSDGTVTGLVVREMHETLGLGANALYDWRFLSQYLRTDGSAEVGADIDAITGATVTTKAITRSVNTAVAYVTGTDMDSSATSWGE